MKKDADPDNRNVNDIHFCRFVMKSVPVAIVTVDSELRITSFNPWAEEITGYTEKDVMGCFCGEILQGGRCQSDCPLKTVLESAEHVVRIETTIRNKWMEALPVRMNTAGLFDDEGNLIGGLEAFQDISYLKILERGKENMISMLAHDMKSPLIGIEAFALRLLKRANDDDKTKSYLNVILRESRKLAFLIDEFLEFSRLKSGKLQLNFSATSLDKELHELYEAFEPRASRQGIRLHLRSDEPLPILEADASRLQRALCNLLDNAIKYSKEGDTILLVTNEKDDEVTVTVIDEGSGIHPDDLPYVFDPFHRGKEGQEKGGFGVGLSTVKAIVEGHGGRVLVKSEVKVGSEFTVVLPKRRKTETEPYSNKS